MSNFYDILGVSKDASDSDIKKSFRTLSLECHPDRNNNSEESTKKFQELNEAYEEILKKCPEVFEKVTYLTKVSSK